MKSDRGSLQVIAFRSILTLSAILILLTGMITILNNFISTMRSYKRETAHIMEYVVSLIGTPYLEKVYDTTKQKYYNIPDDIAQDEYSSEYISYFSDIIDDDFWNARDLLTLALEKNGFDCIAFIFPDVERQRGVFIIDGYDIESAYAPGQWLSAEDIDMDTPEEMEKVSSSELLIYVGHGAINGWIATNYIKVFDSNGDFIGYCLCDVNVTDFINKLFTSAIIFMIIFVIVISFLAYKISRTMKKRIIVPLDTLAVTAEAYTKRDKTVEGEQKAFFENLDISTNDEIETLYHSLADMEKDINHTMSRIREMTAEKERTAAEMDLAAKIQLSMLPSKFPLFPDRTEFDLFASMDPAKDVGGDFYDAFLIDEDHLCLVVADVSGKGVPAALFMVIAKTTIKDRVRLGGSPAQILHDVNNSLCEGNTEMMFVTVWLAILDLSTGELVEANAGHEYPVLIRKNGECELMKREHDFVLGAMEQMEYQDGSYTLSEGDKLLVYTDGLTEATNGEGDLLGEEHMLDIIRKHSADGVTELLNNIRSDVDDFVKDAPQADDLTMLAVEYKK